MTYTGRFQETGLKDPQPFRLFMSDPRRGLIVLMGVPNSVDTTEVGVFFDETSRGNVRVDIASLSSQAVHVAAPLIFENLKRRFPVVAEETP